jgi:hypothetical protein
MSTRIPTEHARPFGLEELHCALFQHRADRGGSSSAISVQVPEAADLIPTAAKLAWRHSVRVLLLCDTADQAVAARRQFAKLAPRHREVSLARAEVGAWCLQ